MKRPMIEKVKSRLRSALNNAKYLTTGNLAHNKACVEMMVEGTLNDIDQIVVETREHCIETAQEVHCSMCAVYEVCHNLDGRNLGGECTAKENIRKVMEGNINFIGKQTGF